VYSLISLGAFLILVSTGYTQYIRAQEQIQRGEHRAERRRRRGRRRAGLLTRGGCAQDEA
jgi:hypothetical protein